MINISAVAFFCLNNYGLVTFIKERQMELYWLFYPLKCGAKLLHTKSRYLYKVNELTNKRNECYN
jgi:hypothetical protein